jgi:hypothetical protein
MKLSIILSTRGRPHLLVPTIRATLKNVRNPETRLVVMADADDEATILTRPQVEKMGASMCVKPRANSLGEKYNAGMQAEPGDVYLVMVDYAPHVTEGFDQRILDAAAIYPDGYAVVYNWWANLAFPGINAVTHKLAVRMGGIYPALYPYWWVDHHLDDVARMIGRIVFAEVEIDVSARQESPSKPWTTDKRDTWLWALLFDALFRERQDIARSIIEGIDFDETPARKRALINNFPWIAHHSAIVNSGARQDPGAPIPSDPWYDEVRAAGLERLRCALSAEQWQEFEALQDRIASMQKAA